MASNLYSDEERANAMCVGKYGAEFRDEAETAFKDPHNFSFAANALSIVNWARRQHDDDTVKTLAEFSALLNSPDTLARSRGALGIMLVCHHLHNSRSAPDEGIEVALANSMTQIAGLLRSDHYTERGAAAWSLVWLGVIKVGEANPRMLADLLTLNRETEVEAIA